MTYTYKKITDEEDRKVAMLVIVNKETQKLVMQEQDKLIKKFGFHIDAIRISNLSVMRGIDEAIDETKKRLMNGGYKINHYPVGYVHVTYNVWNMMEQKQLELSKECVSKGIYYDTYWENRVEFSSTIIKKGINKASKEIDERINEISKRLETIPIKELEVFLAKKSEKGFKVK